MDSVRLVQLLQCVRPSPRETPTWVPHSLFLTPFYPSLKIGSFSHSFLVRSRPDGVGGAGGVLTLPEKNQTVKD